MKKLIHILLIAAVLGLVSWAAWKSVVNRKGAPDEKAEAAEGEKEEKEEFVVKLEKEKWKALGVEMSEPEKAQMASRRMAFGRVLDFSPLITLDNDLVAAEIALESSRAENERSQKLFTGGENASRKVVETARAQFRSDEIKLMTLTRQARIQWGDILAGDAGSRRKLIEAMVAGQSALVRVDLLPGDAIAEQPRGATLLVLGREQQPIQATQISPAGDADPRTQAQGFLIRVDDPPFALRPGMALTAWIDLAVDARPGVVIPRSAILRHDGRTWVYVQEEEERFVRKAVQLGAPVETGWFIEEEGGIKADDLVVVTGAQALLSEELKAQAEEE